MDVMSIAYVTSSVVLAMAGLAMVAAAARAYFVTARAEMLQLSIGFAIVVAAVLSTTIVGLLDGFRSPQLLFTVQYAVMTVGFAFILYSIIGD